MRIAVVFDTPYEGWHYPEHERQMAKEVAAWHHDEPEMEYQVADALRKRGHDVSLLGVRDDLSYLTEALAEFQPDLVFNCAEAFHHNATLEYLVPGMLEAEGYRYTGSPPLSLLVSRNKAMSKKVLAYHGIRVPGFATFRSGESVRLPEGLGYPLIVKPLQSDASAGIAQASVVQDAAALSERVALVHERFHQPAIVEEFIDGRELYVSLIGNGDALDLLPLTEMVFAKDKTRPEERIATQAAKWDEDYRARRGIRNVFARPVSKAVRERIDTICRTTFRVLWLRDYARLDVRLAADGEVWFLEANANPFISYGHDMANAADKAGMDYYRFIERLVNEAIGDMSARSRRRKRAPSPELRCVCGHEVRRYWRHCSNCARALRWGDVRSETGAECFNCGWIVSDRFSWCPWCGVEIYEEGISSEVPLKAPNGFRMDARCDWGCGGGVQYPMSNCPWCGRSQHWNEDDRFEGECPHCARGVDDWMNACPWCGNDATGRDLIPRALTRVRRLLLVSRIRDWGYRVLLRPGISGVDPRWAKIVEIEQRYVVGKQRRDEIPWTMLVGLITHELGHSFLYHHWEWTKSRRFIRAFGEVDKAYRGMDNTWVYFQNRRIAIAPRDHVTAYAAKHPQEDFAETFRFYVTRRGRLRDLFAEFGVKRKGVILYEKFLVLHDYVRALRGWS